jgi:regulator-associated protein of mTOR
MSLNSTNSTMQQPQLQQQYLTAPFFAEQLTAFEVWLELGVQQGDDGEPPRPPEQLPVVLQVLLSQAHRVRAIVLLRRFLSLGPWAVNLALSVGIFPYVLKLLQSPAPELRQILVAIWSKILAFDPSCQVDLVKDDAHGHFISHLNWGLSPPPNSSAPLHQSLPSSPAGSDPSASSQRIMAAFILSAIVHDYPVGQQECLKSNLHRHCVQLLTQTEVGTDAAPEYIANCEKRIPPQFRLWLLIVLGELMKGYEAAQLQMYQHNFHLRLYSRLGDTNSEVRAAACYAIGMLLGGDRQQSPQIPPGVHQQHNDEQRLPLDIVSARALVAACDDGSPIVRYEATVALGSLVGKYLSMFATVANQMMTAGRESEAQAGTEPGSPMTPAPLLEEEDDDPAGIPADTNGDYIGNLESTINEETAEDFAFIWTALRGIQHTDPHPNVCAAALAIVQTVHERVLYLQSRQAELQQQQKDAAQRLKDEKMSDRISSGQLGLDDEGGDATTTRHTLHADPKFSSMSSPLVPPISGVNRGVSAGVGSGQSTGFAFGSPTFEAPIYQTYQMPVSGFFEWRKAQFSYGKEADDAVSGVASGDAAKPLDPMSFEGSLKAYRKRRNDKTHQAAALLGKKYAHLIPKHKGGLGGSSSDTGDDIDGDGTEENSNSGSNNAKVKKSSIKMDQSAVLDNDSDMTSNILFHPYENYLVVCDDFDGISVWNFDDGKKEQSFSNSNSSNSRMTSVKWLNDSILAVGCCDGTVRLWDNVFQSAHASGGDVTPASAFFAAPDMTAGQRGSGLVMEWLDQKQTLICGGNSNMIRSWDMEKEQVVSTFATGSDVCLTCLTNACDKDENGAFVNSSQGPFGPDVVTCGFGDGALRVFDLRAPSKPVMFYAEHGSWIVNTAFTTFGGRPELLSGCISGECKFWDLRLPASLRNLDVQRSPMTAFAVHNKVPLIASGAHAQFLKILDFEGETKNVIRYHEGFLGQRIGAVSCLAFHPHKLLLAAGATDPFISLYSQGE